MTAFTLTNQQVPQPPIMSDDWADLLRWMIVVMNPDDPQLPFAASLLADALKKGALTERQSAAADRLMIRILGAYVAGDLLCIKTGNPPAKVVTFAPRLVVDNTKGGGER